MTPDVFAIVLVCCLVALVWLVLFIHKRWRTRYSLHRYVPDGHDVATTPDLFKIHIAMMNSGIDDGENRTTKRKPLWWLRRKTIDF